MSEKLLQALSEDTDVIAKALRKSDTGLVEVLSLLLHLVIINSLKLVLLNYRSRAVAKGLLKIVFCS